MFARDGTTDHAVLNLLAVLLSVDAAFLSGWLCGRIAKKHERRFVFALALIQLFVAVFCYPLEFWPTLPLGFYIAFMCLIVPATIGGAVYQALDNPAAIEKKESND